MIIGVVKEIKSEENSLPVTLVSEGKVMTNNFGQIKISKQQVFEFLQQNKFKIKNILIFTLDNNGLVYIQEKYKKGQVINTNLKG